MKADNSNNTATNDLVEFWKAAQILGDPLQALSALNEALRHLDAEPEPWELSTFLRR